MAAEQIASGIVSGARTHQAAANTATAFATGHVASSAADFRAEKEGEKGRTGYNRYFEVMSRAEPVPLRVKELSGERVAALLSDDPRLIVPVGGCQSAPDRLPLGCDTLILEHLADALSARFHVLRAPTVEYGATTPSGGPAYHNGPLGGGVRKKTLHRMLNDLLTSWETAGVREFILLSADGTEGHQEALATVITAEARVRVVDVFAMPLGEATRDAARAAILRHLEPHLFPAAGVQEYTSANGDALYERMSARVAERVLAAPVPLR